MKAMWLNGTARGLSFAWGLLLAAGSGVFAQTSNGSGVPIVTVQATRPFATVSNSGAFTVFRAGDTNAALNVWYDLGGTASNGVDYAAIPPHLVEIPAGATSNTIPIVITPPTNPPPLSVLKTVVLTLTKSPLMNPVNYEIGSPSQTTVYIPAPVGIIYPREGTIFYTPTNIPILPFIKSVNSLTNVEFFAGTNDLGNEILNPGGRGWSTVFVWTNPPAGNYALTVVASYYDLAWSVTTPPVGYYAVTSAPVNITVLSRPVTNLPPVVSLVSPANGAAFYAPTDISLIAKAADPDGSVTNVEFFASGAELGRGLPVVLDPPGANGVTGLVFFFNWQNVPTNNYSLTAVATDNGGLSTTSAPVKITIQLPPTNLPPVVRITSPPNNAIFRAPVNIPLYAFAADPDDAVATVEFFAGDSSLGFGQPVNAVPPPLPPGPIQPPILILVPTNYWELVWTNPPLETNVVLTAKATDNGGASATSAPVQISILPSPPPPTNRLPLVGIVATDPVAIEGTNCWPCLGLTNGAPTWSNWIVAASTAALRPITNCGPKNATFAVFRAGATNDDLTVNYLIGGSATNGVDYVTLPGAVQIPVGQRQASISVVPLDDGPPDLNSTVILKLMPGTNYLVGFPANAAAVILDSQSPRAPTGMMPGNVFALNTTGPDGAWFHVECTTDMIHWTPICTNQVVNGGIDFVDPDIANQPVRFYRVVPEDSQPQ